MLPFLPMQYQMSQYLFYIQSQSFVHILPINLHKIMFIFWMSNVFLILPWYLFFRQCCLLSGILAESSVYFRRKNYSGLREYSAYIFVEVVVYVFPPPDVDNLNVFLKYGQLLVKVREFCSAIAAPSINKHHFNKKDSTVDSTQWSAEIHWQMVPQ